MFQWVYLTRFVVVKMGDAESKHRYALDAWQLCKNSMLPDRLPFVVKPNQESAESFALAYFVGGVKLCQSYALAA